MTQKITKINFFLLIHNKVKRMNNERKNFLPACLNGEGNALILLWIFLFISHLPSSPLFPLPPFNLQNLHLTTIAFKLNVVELISVTIPSPLHGNILCASIKESSFEWNHNCIDNCQHFFSAFVNKKKSSIVMSLKLFSWGCW